MTDKINTPKEAPKPKKVERVLMEHPKMKGKARVLETDMAAWLKDGWQTVGSAGNAE